MTVCTTLNRIRVKGPCESGWKKLLAHLGKTKADDALLPFAVIVESNGIKDALWCCESVDYDRIWRLYAVWCARQVQHLMKDPRSISALDVAQAFASGMATRDQLEHAGARARAASWDTAWDTAGDDAWDAAGAAARAAARAAAWAAARAAAKDAARTAVWDTTRAAAWDATRHAARAAAWDAARTAVWDTAKDAARTAARAAAWAAQKAMFLLVVNAPSEEAAVQILLDAMPVKEKA